MEIFEDFLEAYNDDLCRLGCPARVGDPGKAAPPGTVMVLDRDGAPIGMLPDSIEAIELAAVVLMAEQAFARGVVEGQKAKPSAH